MRKPNFVSGESGTNVSLCNAVKAIVCFYAVALLLNAEGLHRGAGRLPYGGFRDAAMAVTEPVVVLGRFFHFTAIRSLVERVANTNKEGVN